MKSKILFIIILLLPVINASAQTRFENGYFINESDLKIECVIKNLDWKNNPLEFEYRIPESEDLKKGNIENVKEFGIYDASKYVRALVKLDRSSAVLNQISYDRNPVLQEERLFLKVLVEGKASLYSYEDGNLTRFFYKTENQEIKQLVYKRFLGSDNSLLENNDFRQQLFVDLKYNEKDENRIKKLSYKKKELERFFEKYNTDNNAAYTNVGAKQKRDLFNLTPKIGLNYNKLSLVNSYYDYYDTDFKPTLNYRFSIETEFILPFNNNKLSIVLDPGYKYLKNSKSADTKRVSGGKLISEIDYKAVELPIGFRYYFFLNEKSKIFTNAFYVFNYSFNSKLDFTRNDGSSLNSLDITSRNYVALGAGYKHNDKWSFEGRYHLGQEILGTYLFWNSKYRTVSLIVGYSLF